jgi:ParB-like chromosome segregation protein Spo0J
VSTKAKFPGLPPRHPLSAIYPAHEGEPLDKLAASIKKCGLRHPIVVFKGWVLDGWRRSLACLKAGVEPVFIEFVGTELEAAEFVEIENAHRRHMGVGDVALTAARYRDYLIKLKDKGFVTELVGSIPDKFNTSKTAVDRATRVLNKAVPEVIAAVDAGTVSVSDAANIVDEVPAVQREAVEAVINKRAPTVTRAVKNKSRNGQPVFDDKVITDAFGKLVRSLIDRRKSMGLEADDPVFTEINDHLNKAWRSMEKWGIEK